MPTGPFYTGAMLKLYSPERAEKIIEEDSSWIREVAERYHIPPAVIKAVLYNELIRIDILDPGVDLAVRLKALSRKDSSTGHMQIFGAVGVKAINFACDRGLASYESLGFDPSRRLDPKNPEDVRTVWMKLHTDPKANIEIAALNLLSCAEEMTGRIDFSGYSDEEMKHVFSRYNANVKHITPYGEEAFSNYQRYS